MADKNRFSKLLPGAEASEFPLDHLHLLGALMSAINRGGESQGIPSGYVYFGQFIDHDMTRLAGSDVIPTGHGMKLHELQQLRTPALDLDSIYGTGFDDPCCATTADGKLALGTTSGPDGSANDLPRQDSTGIAIIADDRNDENLLVAQMHVLFSKLHNRMVDALDSTVTEPNKRFNLARQQTTAIYHNIVLHDFLPTLLDPQILTWLLADDAANALNIYRVHQTPMPVEFAGAAFRFGHSMIRHNYQINPHTSVGLNDLMRYTGKGGFDGNRSLPQTHVVDWLGFFFADPPDQRTNRARRIDQHLVDVLRIHDSAAENGTAVQPDAFLASRNLVRGMQMGLPSGQAFVDELLALHPQLSTLGVRQLAAEELDFRNAFAELPDGHGFTSRTPLWFYLLAEANASHQGLKLGPAASIVVGATIIGILKRTDSKAFADDNEIRDMISLLQFMHEPATPQIQNFPPPENKAIAMNNLGRANSILDFVGEFVAGPAQFPDHSHSNKEGYYPPEGLRIRFDLADFVSLGRGQDYKQGLKLKVTHAPGGTWEGKRGLEAALFYYVDGRLISTPIRSNVRDDANDRTLSFTEVIETQVDRIEDGVTKWRMTHFLLWEDGDRGLWVCGGPP
ncbi:MAG: peroxidase family protein [Pseudomonadales bacterium]